MEGQLGSAAIIPEPFGPGPVLGITIQYLWVWYCVEGVTAMVTV
jgi:hypothetical protein